jgi:O-antigen ligase
MPNTCVVAELFVIVNPNNFKEMFDLTIILTHLVCFFSSVTLSYNQLQLRLLYLVFKGIISQLLLPINLVCD